MDRIQVVVGFALIVVLLALIGCGGGDEAANLRGKALGVGSKLLPPSSPSDQADLTSLDGLIATLPKDPFQSRADILRKRASTNILWQHSGNDTFQRHPDCVADDVAGTLALAPASMQFQWAMYQFPYLLDSDKTLGVTVELTGPPQPYYLGLSDYGKGRWDWHFISAPAGIDQYAIPDSQDCISAGGAVYIAVVAYDGSAITLKTVSLQTDMLAPPPQAFTASDGTRGDGVELSWIDPVDSYLGLNYDNIVIERAPEPVGPWTELVQLPAGTTSYLDLHEGTGAGDNNIPYNTLLYYRARTKVGAVVGLPSPSDSGFRLLATISDLSATDGVHPGKVVVSWTPAVGADGYELYYKESRFGETYWVALALLPGTATEFSHMFDDPDKPCLYNTSYDYRIRARFMTDYSLTWSNVDAGFRVVGNVTGVTATEGTLTDGVTVTWDSGFEVDGYDLYYKRYWHDLGEAVLLAHIDGGDIVSFTHTTTAPLGMEAQPNTVYQYSVKACFYSDRSLDFGVDAGFFGPGAWPQLRHDAQHTGRSQYIGTQDGYPSWDNYRGDCWDGIIEPVIIGPNEVIFAVDLTERLYAFYPDGRKYWQTETAGYRGTPAVDRYGFAYIGGDKLVAFNSKLPNPPYGNILWSFSAGTSVSSPMLGPDGKIYFGSNDHRLYALNFDGSLDWYYETGGSITSAPALAQDGTIYVASTDAKLYAINSNGQFQWDYNINDNNITSPSVDENGNIYLGANGIVLALASDGTLAWSCDIASGTGIDGGPVLATDGSVYVTGSNGSGLEKLCAISPAHAVAWTYTLAASGGGGGSVSSNPAIGADGLIYVGSFQRLYAIQSSGSLKFMAGLGTLDNNSSPAIGLAGTVIIGSSSSGSASDLYAYGYDGP